MDILIIFEHSNGKIHRMSWEAVAAGQSLAKDLGLTTAILILGSNVNELVEEASKKDVDEVLAVDHPVKKELEAGWFQWVSMDLPACITIQSGLNTPRYPSLRGIMGAKKKEIKVMASTPQGELLQSLEKIYIPKKTKLTEMIEGDTDQVVAKLVDVLKRDIKVL